MSGFGVEKSRIPVICVVCAVVHFLTVVDLLALDATRTYISVAFSSRNDPHRPPA